MAKRKPKYPQVVCKPCWELKYCPYGVLVEEFPLRPGERSLSDVRARFGEVMDRFARKELRTREQISEMVRLFLYNMPENWEHFDGYDTSEIECNVFGHVCPVFLVAEGTTETVESRRVGSRHVPREVMLKVVRRDGQMCQICHSNVPDNELHLDHIIPFSRGGTSTAENLRVLCATCNREKGDSLEEILWR